MSFVPSQDPAQDAAPRDEVAERRNRRAPDSSALTEPAREDYELQLDAFQAQLADYRARIEDYAARLEAAHRDGLTGTWVRQAGQQLLDEELLRAARTDTPLSIAFVDVDGLKAINDSLGHTAGDAALITVARCLLVGLRGYDHVVRWGGDEFLCVVPGLTEAEAHRRLEQAREFAAASGGVTISFGVVERHAGETSDSLVARADSALYASRRAGRRR